MSQGQALLKRNPNMTREEFSDYWYKVHGPLVVPWCLKYGIVYYAQTHNPTLSSPSSHPELDIKEWDGGAEMRKGPSPAAQMTSAPGLADGYFVNVILPDERKFLVSNATEHLLVVYGGVIDGDKRMIIEDGKAVVEVGEEIWQLWREWEAKDAGKKAPEIF